MTKAPFLKVLKGEKIKAFTLNGVSTFNGVGKVGLNTTPLLKSLSQSRILVNPDLFLLVRLFKNSNKLI